MIENTRNLMYLGLSVPALYILIALDTWYSAKKLGKTRTWRSFFENVNISMGQQVFGAYTQLMVAVVYALIYENFRIFDLPISPLVALLAFLMLDFNTYVFHWLSHKVNFLWANHTVHHSAEEFGLAVSVRHPWFAAILLSIAQYSLAFVGVSPKIFFPLITAFYLFQFFSHTESVPKLGILEKVFVTPTHHRVHHGKNARYLDCNYGAVLIIWDKIFGTFKEYTEEPEYGLVHPTQIKNMVWENLYYYVYLWKGFFHLQGLQAKIQFLFGSPEKQVIDSILQESIGLEKSVNKLARPLHVKVRNVLFGLSFVLTIIYMITHHSIHWGYSVGLGTLIMMIVFWVNIPNKSEVTS